MGIQGIQGIQGVPGVKGDTGEQGIQGPQGPTSVEYGVYVLHDTAVPLGGYPAARSASLTGSISRLYVETDDTVVLQVTVGGSEAYYGSLAAGTHALALTAAVAAQDEVTFYFSAGTPTSVWAQIDGGSP